MKNIAKVDDVQHKTTKIIPSWVRVMYFKVSIEKGFHHGKKTESFEVLNGSRNVDKS